MYDVITVCTEWDGVVHKTPFDGFWCDANYGLESYCSERFGYSELDGADGYWQLMGDLQDAVTNGEIKGEVSYQDFVVRFWV